IHDTRELDQDAVTRGLHDPTTVRSNRGGDQLTAQRAETRNGSLLVHPDQTAITRHIGGKDRCKPALDALALHGLPPQRCTPGECITRERLCPSRCTESNSSQRPHSREANRTRAASCVPLPTCVAGTLTAQLWLFYHRAIGTTCSKPARNAE